MNSFRQRRLGFLDGHTCKDGVSDNHPQQNRETPQNQREPRGLKNDQPLTAENAGRRNRSEEPWTSTMID